jgi:transposase
MFVLPWKGLSTLFTALFDTQFQNGISIATCSILQWLLTLRERERRGGGGEGRGRGRVRRGRGREREDFYSPYPLNYTHHTHCHFSKPCPSYRLPPIRPHLQPVLLPPCLPC